MGHPQQNADGYGIRVPLLGFHLVGDDVRPVFLLVESILFFSSKVFGVWLRRPGKRHPVIRFRDVEGRLQPGPVSAGNSVVDAPRKRVTADGEDAATITVTLMDAYGHAVPGVMVTLTADSDNAVIQTLERGAPVDGNSGMTDENGVIKFLVTNTAVETVTLIPSADGQMLESVRVQFVAETVPGPGPSPGPAPPAPVTPAEPDEPEESEKEGTTEEKQEESLPKVLRGDLIDEEAWLMSLAERLRAAAGREAPETFPDVDGHWALGPIGLLFRLEVVNGYEDGSFRSDQPVTRAEFAAMLVRLFAFRDPTAEPASFADLEGHWGREAIELLSAPGVVNGYPDGTFRPDDPITREENTVMVMRILDAAGLPQTEERESGDIAEAGVYAREFIQTGANAGIIQGYEDGTFRPKGQATRAETATMLVIPGARELIEP